ncbi:MAG: bifunctional phosphoserine phosphatase/homoserine phosphotransferase ThrH [Chloroflexota bacterium]
MSNFIKPTIITFDLEGVFIPEIWIAVAEHTGIEELRKTTRDISDYDELMRYRLGILKDKGITLNDIQQVIETMDPLPGAADFLTWVREITQVLIITDSFYPFVTPFLPKLKYPTVFAHTLEVSSTGSIQNYHLRTTDGKRKVVESLKEMGFRTMAVGDSYNDTRMLMAADKASLFCPPPNVVADFPQLPVSEDYAKLASYIEGFLSAVN